MKKIQFSKNFSWGNAASGPQNEGSKSKKTKNNWEHWFDINEDIFYKKIGPYKTIEQYDLIDDDIKLMKEIGIKSYRTSIQWTRLFSDVEKKIIDPDGVKFYNHLIDLFEKNNIELIMGLFHFDMPYELQKNKGLLNREFVEYFTDYAKSVFQLFGKRIKKWVTFNEPVVPAEMAYVMGFHFPALPPSILNFLNSSYITMLAHANAVQAFKNCPETKESEIGIVLNLTPAYSRSENFEDKEAARICNLLLNDFFVDLAVNGVLPDGFNEFIKNNNYSLKSETEDLEIFKNNTIDFLGVNYYFPRRVQTPSKKNVAISKGFEKYFEVYTMPNARINKDRGWEIFPKAIYDIAKTIQTKYNNIPWYISENGMGVGNESRYLNSENVIEDNYRIEFIKEHLFYLNKAIEEGSNCFGYHVWTFIDNWSWLNSFKNRYGFVSVDYKTQKRTKKKSFHWFKKLIETGSFDIKDNQYD